MRILKSGTMPLALLGPLVVIGCNSAEEREREKKALAEAKEKQALDEEYGKLEGRWKVVLQAGQAYEPGSERPKEVGVMSWPSRPEGEVVLSVDKEKGQLVRSDNGEVTRREKITLYPATDPKQIDLVLVDGAGKPIGLEGRPTTTEYKRLGVYKVENDTLTLAYSRESRPRGVDPGYNRVFLKLQKVRDGGDRAADKEKDKDHKSKGGDPAEKGKN